MKMGSDLTGHPVQPAMFGSIMAQPVESGKADNRHGS
jgi:hypothetical protein